jgi:hypothetical protein
MTVLGMALTTAALAIAPLAQAQPGRGCQSEHVGLLRIKVRQICDTPRAPDGSWTRTRTLYVPAHSYPASSSCDEYSCTWSDGGYVDDAVTGRETYVVTDDNIPPFEPGWLPPGTDILR